MAISLAQVHGLNTGVCEVTLSSPAGSEHDLRFDVKYSKAIPTELSLALMEIPLLGDKFTRILEETNKIAAGKVPSSIRQAQLEANMDKVNAKLHRLPEVLSKIVIWQDVEGAETPDEAFFESLGLEKQIEYATCVLLDKQRPTIDSAKPSPIISTPAESKDTLPSNIEPSESPSGLAAEAIIEAI